MRWLDRKLCVSGVPWFKEVDMMINTNTRETVSVMVDMSMYILMDQHVSCVSEAGQVYQWPCSPRKPASGSAKIASGRMCTSIAQGAAPQPRANRLQPGWTCGGWTSPLSTVALAGPILGTAYCQAVLHSWCQPKAFLTPSPPPCSCH